MEATECVLGIHLTAGTVWLALAAGDGNFREDRTDRFEFADGALGASRALCELEDSLVALLRRLQPHSVALLGAGGSQHASGVDSRRRGWLEAMIMAATHHDQRELVWVTHPHVERVLGLRPTTAQLRSALAARLAGAPPDRWSERVRAYAAALVVVEGVSMDG